MSNKAPSYLDEVLERSRLDSRLPEEEFGKSPYDMYCVPLEVYETYKDQVLRLCLTYQEWEAPSNGSVVLERVNQLSDREAAERLGIDAETVRKVRCMADWDIPVELWRNAAEFKRAHRLERPLGCSDRDIKGEPG